LSGAHRARAATLALPMTVEAQLEVPHADKPDGSLNFLYRNAKFVAGRISRIHDATAVQLRHCRPPIGRGILPSSLDNIPDTDLRNSKDFKIIHDNRSRRGVSSPSCVKMKLQGM